MQTKQTNTHAYQQCRQPTRIRLIYSLKLSALCLVLFSCANLTPPNTQSTAGHSPNTTNQSQTPSAQQLEEDPNCLVDPSYLASQNFLSSQKIPQHNDIWSRIRAGFTLESPNNARIKRELLKYKKHPKYMQRMTERSAKYIYHIAEQVEKRDLPMELALLPIVESGFDPFAYSHGRASGIWQFIPGTGKMLGLEQNWWYDGRRDIRASTDAAITYLERHYKRFDKSWLLALAAYNSGAGTVSKAIKRNLKRGKATDFWSLKLPRETMAYVPRLLAISQLVAKPEKHQISLHPVDNTPYFGEVNLDSQIDLAQAAELAEMDMQAFYQLNPAFNQWATPPSGPHALLIPIEKTTRFKQALAALPKEKRISWDRYSIRNGDSLSAIARRYNLSVKSLKTINRLRGNNIRAGNTLMVPIAAKPGGHYSLSIAERQRKAGDNGRGTKIHYTVRPGDSLWTIANKHKISHKAIAKWNNITPNTTIRPKQRLVLWVKTVHDKVRKISYKVKKGDSLSRIASHFRVRIKDILQWNRLKRSKHLQPGQALTLFIDVTRAT